MPTTGGRAGEWSACDARQFALQFKLPLLREVVDSRASALFRSPSGTGQPPLDPVRLLVRTARSRDLQELAEILTLSFHPPEGWMLLAYPLLKLGIYEDLRARLCSGSPHYCCLAAIALPSDSTAAPEIVAGTVELGLRPLRPQQRSQQWPYISNLAVSQAYRRQGIARRLLAQCEPLAVDWGYQDIYLHVLETNQQAQQLYRSCGYRVAARETTWAAQLLRQPSRLLLHKRLEVPNPS